MRRNSLGWKALVSLALALSSAAFSGRALAYCRTSSCAEKGSSVQINGTVCEPMQAGDCGTPLFWSNPCVGFSLQKDASTEVPFAVIRDAITKAFATWTSASCAGKGSPRISVTEQEPVDCNTIEYNTEKDIGNANVIMFRDNAWPYGGGVLALTTVSYHLETGQIYDADMEINTAYATFSTGDTDVKVDLLSIVTHEAGHFLGLSHVPDPTATMFPNYMPGDINQRELSPDDIAGICAIYPSGDSPSDCDATPRHCFSTVCGDVQQACSMPDAGCGDEHKPCSQQASQQAASRASGCCAVAPGFAAGSGSTAGIAAATLALGLAARRRRRAEPSR